MQHWFNDCVCMLAGHLCNEQWYWDGPSQCHGPTASRVECRYTFTHPNQANVHGFRQRQDGHAGKKVCPGLAVASCLGLSPKPSTHRQQSFVIVWLEPWTYVQVGWVHCDKLVTCMRRVVLMSHNPNLVSPSTSEAILQKEWLFQLTWLCLHFHPHHLDRCSRKNHQTSPKIQPQTVVFPCL